MADGSNGPAPAELGITQQDLGINPDLNQQPTKADTNEQVLSDRNKSLRNIGKLAEGVWAGTTRRTALDNYVDHAVGNGVPFDQITRTVKVVEDPIKAANRWTTQKNPDGTISVFDKDGKVMGAYEKGFLDVALPSGTRTHILADSRIIGEAEYSYRIGAIVLGGETLREIADPQNPAANEAARKLGFNDLEQKTKYFIKHEYSHLIWDQLDSISQRRIMDMFSGSENLVTTRAFAAVLISKKEYQDQEEMAPDKETFDFTFGRRVHRYSKELVINELLAHQVLGDMATREDMTRIQRSTDKGENFGARSKAAFDALVQLRSKNPQDYYFLKQVGLVNNQTFEQDYSKIVSSARSLHTNSPQGMVQVN